MAYDSIYSSQQEETPKFTRNSSTEKGEVTLDINFSRVKGKIEQPKQKKSFICQYPKGNVGPLKVVSGAYTIGKNENNEDAYFIMDRGFGVADGVGAWLEFGFSSAAFSNELMNNCAKEIDMFEKNSFQKVQSKKRRKNRSFMSMDMLELKVSDDEADDEMMDA